MARKIFVSYKHSDSNVKPLNGQTTARDYVEELIVLFEGNEIYKGEGNEDLSEFKDETIETHLKDKIYDSSITLVLISPSMKDSREKESDQWIPWEVSYSLKEISRQDRKSRTNAILAVVLPNWWASYSYFLEENTCQFCNCRTLNTPTLFQILGKNMLNVKKPIFSDCRYHPRKTVYLGKSSFIYSVKWCDFVGDKERYLLIAEERRNNIDDYHITKIVKD